MKFKLIFFWIAGALPIIAFSQNIITVTDADVPPGAQVTWTSDNIYLLNGYIFVEDGTELTIEAGTVVKGMQTPTTGDNTSALFVAQGGKIFASGTASQPIIFTSELDDVDDPFDLALTDRGLWGGIIILGKAAINTASGVGQIEGIPTTEPRGTYGGGSNPDDGDDSGELRYVSIRHGGAELGVGSGNEINGLTLGAVGSGTTIEYVEVFANLDDGFEWFGGTVNTKYLAAVFCGDDGFDYDEGFRGKGQFWFVLQGTDAAGRCAEMDGGTNPEDGQPYAIPVITNATYIGAGSSANPEGDNSQCLIFRDNAGGKYSNSIFTQFQAKGITVEDLDSGEDSRNRLEQGDLEVSNNIWWDFKPGNDLTQIADQDFVQSHLLANNNQIVDPQLANVSREQAGILDPRPSGSGPAATGASVPSDTFFTQVNYYGAFDPESELWTSGWTALYSVNITSIIGGEGDIRNLPGQFALNQNYPNPFNPETSIRFELPQNGMVNLSVFNSLGQKVTNLVNGYRHAGIHEVSWNALDMPSGFYFYQLQTGGMMITKKMILAR